MAAATRPARVYVAPRPSPMLNSVRDIGFPTNAHGPFEHLEGPGHVALAEGQQAHPA